MFHALTLLLRAEREGYYPYALGVLTVDRTAWDGGPASINGRTADGLARRGYVVIHEDPEGSTLSLTPAGRAAALEAA